MEAGLIQVAGWVQLEVAGASRTPLSQNHALVTTSWNYPPPPFPVSSVTTLIVMLKRTADEDHDNCHDEGYCEGGGDGNDDKRIMIRTNERTGRKNMHEGKTSSISPDTVLFFRSLLRPAVG